MSLIVYTLLRNIKVGELNIIQYINGFFGNQKRVKFVTTYTHCFELVLSIIKLESLYKDVCICQGKGLSPPSMKLTNNVLRSHNQNLV